MEAKRITNSTDLEKAFSIRKEVFVKEQGVPVEMEIDQYDTLDGRCEHILVLDHEQHVGTGRLRVVEGIGKLERICTLENYRKMGVGNVIVSALETIAKENGLTKVKLHAQTQAEGFYQKLGYQTSSDVFLEENIPHVLMIKELI